MMTDLLFYSLESAICLTVLTIFYYFFLRKETFFGMNRIYLLFSIGYALLIPFLNINYGFPAQNTADSGSIINSAISNAEVMKQNVANQLDPVVIVADKSFLQLNLSTIIIGIYLLGVAIHLALSGIRFTRLFYTVRKSEKHQAGKFCYVKIPDQSEQVFSFFRYIFIGSGKTNLKDYKQIIDHEKSHASLFHSVDLIFIEFLIILQWFNPFIYLLRKMVVENHEYQADSSVVRSSANKGNYLKLILNHVLNNQYFKMTSAFSYSLSKKRLKMLTKRKTSHYISKAKLLAVIPVALLLFFFFACSQSTENDLTKQEKDPVLFKQINTEQAGEKVPEFIINDYQNYLKEKGEQIQYELYAEFGENEYAETKIVLEKNMTYGLHLYNYNEGDSESYLQDKTRNYFKIKDENGNVVATSEKTVKHGKREQHMYVDMQTETGTHTLVVKDSKNNANKVAFVLTKATSLGNKPNKEEDEYLVVEEMPVYDKNKAVKDFRNDVMQNIDYPEEAKKENIDGTVFISFIVNKEGKITDKKIARGAHPLLDQAAMEAFDGTANWKPGKKDGKPVNVKYTIPVVFKLK